MTNSTPSRSLIDGLCEWPLTTTPTPSLRGSAPKSAISCTTRTVTSCTVSVAWVGSDAAHSPMSLLPRDGVALSFACAALVSLAVQGVTRRLLGAKRPAQSVSRELAAQQTE